MDARIRGLERQFQQEETISNLVALMRARARSDFYRAPAPLKFPSCALRHDNNLYRVLLGQDLVRLMDSPQISNYDYISYVGMVEVLGTKVTVSVDLNSSKELSIVSMNLPNNLTYDLVCPPNPGQLIMIVYGLEQSAVRLVLGSNVSAAKEEMYAPGDVPFGSGLELCEHMLRTWRAKEASHGR